MLMIYIDTQIAYKQTPSLAFSPQVNYTANYTDCRPPLVGEF
jgi:hypothetical protein